MELFCELCFYTDGALHFSDDCIFVEESAPTLLAIKNPIASKTPAIVSSKDSVPEMPDLNAIPLPGESITCTSEDSVEHDTKPTEHELLSACPQDPTSIPETPEQTVAESNQPELPPAAEVCEKPETKSPLSRIQMLIKEKAEKLKGSTVFDNKPVRIKNLSLSFGIGKSKVKSAEKVKFSVIKLDKKVAVFHHDSDEEDTPKASVISPVKLHAISSADMPVIVTAPKHIVDYAHSSNAPVKQETGDKASPNHVLQKREVIKDISTSKSPKREMGNNASLSNQLVQKPEVSKDTPASKSPIKVVTESDVSSNKSPHERKIKPPSLSTSPIKNRWDVTQSKSSKSSRKSRFSASTEQETLDSTVNIAVPRILCESEDLESKTASKGTVTTSEAASSVSPALSTTRLSDFQSQQAVCAQSSSLKSHDVLCVNKPPANASNPVGGRQSWSSTCSHNPKPSYEADSTIPDEGAVHPSIKSLELYSDEESLDESEVFKDKLVDPVNTPQPSVGNKLSVSVFADEVPTLDEHAPQMPTANAGKPLAENEVSPLTTNELVSTTENISPEVDKCPPTKPSMGFQSSLPEFNASYVD